MRFILLTFMLFHAVYVQADTIYTVRWIISGIKGVSEISADIEFMASTFSLHATLKSAAGNAAPVSGTCITNSLGGVNCSIESGNDGYAMVVDSTLSGNIVDINDTSLESWGKAVLQDVVAH